MENGFVMGGGLKRSASFRINVDKVEVEPVIRYEPLEEGEEECEPDQDDEEEEVVIPGVDWESVKYAVHKFSCQDEVTGLDVSENYIVAQYFLEPSIDVFDRKTQKLLHRLEGHEYGGQAVCIYRDLLYSGSKDCSLRSWDLKDGDCIQEARHHKDYIQCVTVKTVNMPGLGEEMTCLVTGGAADHMAIVYKTDPTGRLDRRFSLTGHGGWVTQVYLTNTMIVTGSQDKTVRMWDLATGDLLQTFIQDGEISCLSMFPLLPGYLMFGDAESKLSLLDLSTGSTRHLMPNIMVGTGRYRRSSKYHDKSVDNLHVSDNGYVITASSGSKFVKIWKVNSYKEDVANTDVVELQILRDHSDYLSVIKVEGDTVFSCSGDGNIYMHRFPVGERHYDMLTTDQERNSVAVLYQGPERGLAPAVERPTIMCEGKLCKAGKTGLAKSSSSFEVCFALKPLTHSLTMTLPQVLEDSEDEESCEFVIEYVTDDDSDDLSDIE